MAENQPFDPTRVLDGWRAPEVRPADADPDLELSLGAEAARRQRLRARGFAMHEVEDVEPQMAPALGESAQPMEASAALVQSRSHPRVLAQWQPRAWLAQCRRVCGPSVEIMQTPAGPVIDNRDPQWLCALWPPQRIDVPLLGRWPEGLALLTAQSCTDALVQALARLPDGAELWHADLDADWVLIAELALHQQPGLRADQIQRLRELQQLERDQAFERLNLGYRPHDGQVWRRP